MPAETFYCPHCQRQLMKSAAAFVLGEAGSFIALGDAPPRAAPCPGCGGPIDVAAMIAGRYDAPPVNVPAAVGCLVVGLLVVAFFGWRHLDEKAREADPFRMRLFFAQDIEEHDDSPRPFDALAYYEAAARGLTGGRRETALARADELARQLREAQPQVVHQDALLSSLAPTLPVRDASGALVGTLTLREKAQGFEVDFTLPGVEPTDGALLELRGETVNHGASASVLALRVPYGPDPPLLQQGRAHLGRVNGPSLFDLDLQAVPSAVSPSAPAEEVREGQRAVRVHLVLTTR